MTIRWTWLESGHHFIVLSCWERGLALVPSLGPWGTQLRQPQILWVAAGSGCLSCMLGRGMSMCPLGNASGGRGQSPFCGWSGLGWDHVAAGGLILRAALAGVGLVPIKCGIWTGGELLDFWGWHCNYSIITILLVCYVSSKPSREAPSLRPPRSQSRSAQFSSFPCPLLLSWLFKNLRSCCWIPFMNSVWYKNPSSSANMHSCHIEHTF